jgi:hypothetical protein
VDAVFDLYFSLRGGCDVLHSYSTRALGK